MRLVRPYKMRMKTLDRQIKQNEKRSSKMSRKLIGGNFRAAKAAGRAELLRVERQRQEDLNVARQSK